MTGDEAPSVLLVDDEPAVARVYARWLREAGVDVSVCSEPVSALRRVTEGERFDVVICDCAMPTLGGIEFFERATSVWPELAQRIVFISGGVTAEDARFLRKHGLPSFGKPLPRNGAELAELVDVILARVGRAARAAVARLPKSSLPPSA